MSKPKGHKAIKRIQRVRSDEAAKLRQAAINALKKERPPENNLIYLKCDCEEILGFPAKQGNRIDYKLTCPFCGRIEFVRWRKGKKAEMLPRGYKGKSKALVPRYNAPFNAFTKWRNAMPPYEYIVLDLAKMKAYENVRRKEAAEVAPEAHKRRDDARTASIADRLARADKRGDTPPMIPNARWLVSAVKSQRTPEQLPTGSLVYDFAKFISWDRCNTWPTMHDFVMAFAQPRKVLSAIIRKVPKNRKRLTTSKRPVRYSPSVVHYLIKWWLDNEGKTVEPIIRNNFKHIAKAICH